MAAPDTQRAIEKAMSNHLAVHGRPNVTSVSDDCHLFHYASNPAASPLVFVNRNGNHCRLMQEADDGEWKAYKTWNHVTSVERWQNTGIAEYSFENALDKISVGPGEGRNEMLTFLPKTACSDIRRVAVWRQHMLAVRFFTRSREGFTLHADNGESSPCLGGKVWESDHAARW